MALSAEQVSKFERDGFLVLPSVLPPEQLGALLSELHSIKSDVEQKEEQAADGAWDERGSGADAARCTFALTRDAQGRLLRPARMHKAQGIALRSRRVLELLRSPGLALPAAALVRRGLGDPGAGTPRERLEVDAFGTKFFPVERGSPGSVSWHDDNYYFGTVRSHTVSCAVYLRSIDAASGCLRVVPGSHRDAAVGSERAQHYLPSPQQHGEYIPDEAVVSGPLSRGPSGEPRSPVDVAVPAGSAVLFDANLLHCAHPNTRETPSERVAFHYIPGDLDSGFRGTSFARGRFADRHLAVCSDLTPAPSPFAVAARL
eukprot:TRINITY_DN6671_c0_g1_i2.p2 TRINITY_DN6671_c0_g1~~TRINITY_DN6671_c0_g1_i2.p2  ORF type:complete len:344 (+),score=128.74 TRINITY_DN6671_c0_g1_i2:85-1032(+)